jgi:hypothetical protein
MHNKKDILNLEAEISGSGMSICFWWCNSHCELISLNSLLAGYHKQYPHLFSQVSVLPSLHTSYIKCSRYMRTVFFWTITQPVVVIGFPQTSVGNYHYSVCNSPEEHSSHLCSGRLKLCVLVIWSITQLNYFSDIYRVLVNVFHW